MHSAAISAHAVSGLVSFIAGCVLLSRTPDRVRQPGAAAVPVVAGNRLVARVKRHVANV